MTGVTPSSPRSDPAALPLGFVERVDAVVGPRGWTTDPERIAAHVVEQWGTAHGRSPLLLRPGSTQEVAAVLSLCNREGVAVVPQSGNTGLTGGGVPDESGRQAILSLQRLDRVREVDPLNDTITAEAGCVLATIQAAAAEADRLFPLSLGAEGSCRIGGNLATNAGGVNVLRYGMARQLVLGLEVVLADGRIWDGLRGLRKDNTGYDLKQLFIGSEGTLGVITAAVLRLFPRPRQRETAWLGVPSPQAAVELLALFKERLGEIVSSFELMPDPGIGYVVDYLDGARRPIEAPCAWHVLAEVAWALDEPLAARIEPVLEAAMARGLVVDGVLATSEAQRTALWLLRENMTDAMAQVGPVLRHDVSVPVSKVPALVEQGGAEMVRLIPGVRVVPFGHVGDGNVHFNLLPPEGAPPEAFRARKEEVLGRVFDVVESLGGSISAEHGIGRLKRDELARRKSEVELSMMRALKATLDPKGILNPGAVL